MSAIVHLQIPCGEAERAKKFYTELFGWKMAKFSSAIECGMIKTKEGMGGGMMKMGYYAICVDTEGNVFGLCEDDPQAK